MQEEDSDAFVELLLLAARVLGPVIRRFISLGLNRVWLKAGDPAYRWGPHVACLPDTCVLYLESSSAVSMHL